MKRFHLDLGHRHFLQHSYSEYDPNAVKEMLAALSWQEEQEVISEFEEHISEEDLGLPKNLLTPDEFYFPENYEKNYSYPLIIWLTNNENPIQEIMPRVSDQNYLGLEISLNQFPQNNATDICCDQLLSHIQEEREEFHQQANIHAERIYLAGVGEAASLATKLTLMHPLEFAGFIAINPVNRGLDHPLANFRFLKHLQCFLATTKLKTETQPQKIDLQLSKNLWVKPFSQLLHDAGVNIQLDTQQKTEANAFGKVNHFIMQAITGSQIIK